MASFLALFSPGSIGQPRLRNRILMARMREEAGFPGRNRQAVLHGLRRDLQPRMVGMTPLQQEGKGIDE